jgi:hypothetical protein
MHSGALLVPLDKFQMPVLRYAHCVHQVNTNPTTGQVTASIVILGSKVRNDLTDATTVHAGGTTLQWEVRVNYVHRDYITMPADSLRAYHVQRDIIVASRRTIVFCVLQDSIPHRHNLSTVMRANLVNISRLRGNPVALPVKKDARPSVKVRHPKTHAYLVVQERSTPQRAGLPALNVP